MLNSTGKLVKSTSDEANESSVDVEKCKIKVRPTMGIYIHKLFYIFVLLYFTYVLHFFYIS